MFVVCVSVPLKLASSLRHDFMITLRRPACIHLECRINPKPYIQLLLKQLEIDP